MIKLLRYLKPYTLGVIAAILLLFAQAICELNLPNYMSDIVNVGIQQNGIEHASPDAISEKAMNFSEQFMSSEQKSVIKNNYTLKTKGDALSDKYPLLLKENVYVLNDNLNKSQREDIDILFGTNTWTMINTFKEMSKLQSAAGAATAQSSDKEMSFSDISMSELYKTAPMLKMLKPAAIDKARTDAKALDSTMLTQSGAMMTKAFYTELGLSIESIESSYIFRIGGIMLLIALLSGASAVMVGLISAKIGAGAAKNMRRDVFSKVESFSHTEFDKFSTATLITRSTNDVTQVQMLIVMGLRLLCYAPIMGIGGLIMAINKSVSLSWVIGVACLALISLIITIFIVAMPKFKRMQKLIDRVNLVAREHLSGLMVIRAFGTRKFEENRFKNANDDLTNNQLYVNRVMVFMMPAMMLIMNGISLLIVWVGGHLIADSALKIGDMLAYIQYAMQVIMSFLMIAMMFIMVPRAAVSGDRIQEVLSTDVIINDPKTGKQFDKSKTGYVEFNHVSFKYHGASENVLQDISFVAKPGQTTAIIGSTGSGKSTLINLIPRFYDVTEGEVTVNGVNVKDVMQHDLRSEIGYIPQKGSLFSGTIASNLRFGNEQANEEQLWQALKIAQSEDFVKEKEDTINSHISQSGTNVSGGQKQRLSIARALVKNAPIYIFDDTFSALDYKTDTALRKALKQYTGGSTVIIVAQRVSTIMHAEQILVLDEGKIVGKGTHSELLKTCPEYLEIASSQLSKEEL